MCTCGFLLSVISRLSLRVILSYSELKCANVIVRIMSQHVIHYMYNQLSQHWLKYTNISSEIHMAYNEI